MITQLGAYRIERELGRGGFGVVYEAVDTRLERRVAIKQLLPQFTGRRDIVERFFNEARAIATLDHPGIVEIYDVGWDDAGSAYFAMKLLVGESLLHRLRTHGMLSIAVATSLARQIAAAVAAAHARNIVHRDLKPENVILVRDPEIGERAIVVDFGIAKLVDDAATAMVTSTGSLLGSPLYMSPEQCRGAENVDHRTDVYALGCIVYQMLAGVPPHVGETPAQLVGMHQFVEPAPLCDVATHVPSELGALVMRALAKDPAARIALADFAQALEPYTHSTAMAPVAKIDPLGATITPDRETAVSVGISGVVGRAPAAPAPRSRTWVWLAGAGALVAIAIGLSIALRPDADSPRPPPRPNPPIVVRSNPDATLPPSDDCAQLEAARRWNDLIPCAQKMRINASAARSAAAEAYIRLASNERNAEEAYNDLAKDLKLGVLKNADYIVRRRIDPVSVYYPEALALYRQTEPTVIDAAVAFIKGRDCPTITSYLVELRHRQGDSAVESVRARARCSTPCPECADPKNGEECLQSYERDSELGSQLMLHGQYDAALRIYETGLAGCRPDHTVWLVKTAGAACRAKNETAVMRYFKKLSPTEQIDVGRICTENGVTIR